MKTNAFVVALASSLTAGALASLGSVAVAQQGAEFDAALFDQGQQLYEANCIACHQAGGVGLPPTFPALNRNERLVDLELIVGNIQRGKGAMPAFPDLTADETAALATYVRNAWDNAFGGSTPEEVAAIVDRLEEIGPQVSVWTGVYTEAQNERGEAVHSVYCVRCHSRRLTGGDDADYPPAPAIARGSFTRRWQGRSIASLYEFVRATMPQDIALRTLMNDQQVVDAIAHMLAVSNMPAGEEELPPDAEALAGIVIEAPPEQN